MPPAMDAAVGACLGCGECKNGDERFWWKMAARVRLKGLRALDAGAEDEAPVAKQHKAAWSAQESRRRGQYWGSGGAAIFGVSLLH
jgi:hypothetical protein